jgi:hypothetical protein
MYVLSFQNSKALQQKNLISEVRQRGGGEYIPRSFIRFCKGQTIEQLTWTNTPHQNEML